MKTAKIFKNGQSQAVRLPKEFRFEGNTVYIHKQGKHVILSPKEEDPWASMFEAAKHFSSDFMCERDQGEQEPRESID